MSDLLEMEGSGPSNADVPSTAMGPPADSFAGVVADAVVVPSDAIIPSNEAEAGPPPRGHGDDAREEWSEPVSVESVLEAVLFSGDRPIPARRLAQIVGIGNAADIRRHVDALNQRYAEIGASFRIESIAKGYQMLTLPVYDKWIGQLVKSRKDSRLSPAALETLAVIAYKQPAMRADVEAVRGVAVGDVLARLREMKLIKIVGRAEEIGRPLLYGTTDRFLEVFGLASLKDLPSVEALAPPETARRPRLANVPPAEAEEGPNEASSPPTAEASRDAS